ncbi:Insulin-like growth factor binding protein, N-terminal [Pseudocohnilembus persalinus]|uniref:Insulin-like growth factor binding protein, N-terminal n=1 Tax=Pseudocohnilembus persalinus TaxID=266149 RepID=A0A0V0R619_PSEPJ|nr:Insulin-like growth factor binding protein, N-terminal [Pseudocohnilembus persalinus]|eukprot:KRX09934.1 Insulin-like growth factor binding protein, N-terminal [Pseudocohnilembus persalinus]
MNFDSLQLSQKFYANLIKSYDLVNNQEGEEFLIQILDCNGLKQCKKAFQAKGLSKYSLTNTNVENELFFAYISQNTNLQIFFGFLNESCNFSRGLISPAQPNDFTDEDFYFLQSISTKEYVYIVAQQYQYYNPSSLYLIIVDISDKNTYDIKAHVKLGTVIFKLNLFCIQAFSDKYLVIFGKDDNNQQQRIIIEPNGNEIWDNPKNEGIFMSLNYQLNYIQNKVIQIENTNKYSIVTGDAIQDIFTIYTFQYNGNGEIQDICLKTYQNQFENVEQAFFIALEFGVINANFMWIKGDNVQLNENGVGNKTIIFFANPQDCQLYRDQNDNIYNYKLKHFSRTHILHTYNNNQNVQLIVSSSLVDGNITQNTQAIKIYIDECHSKCIGCDGEPKKCIKCQKGNRQDLSENCDCLPGFHDNMGLYKKCIKCPHFFKNCINEKYCTECDYGYVLNEITHQCGKCAHGEIWNQFKKQCQKCFYYKKDCVFQCPENTVEKKFNTCVEKEYIEYQSYEYWLIIFGSICIIQQIIFFIFLDWKIKKIIKYEVQKQKEEVIKNYELMAEEEYQQKQKFAEPSVQQKDKQKLKENLSLLIMNQNLLKIIKKEYSQENQKDSQQLQQNQQEQIQTDNLKNTQSELNQEIQVEKKKKKLQNKKRMKKKKELKKIYNQQDSLSITINNNSNSKPKTNSNLKNIQMKTFKALKK